MSIKLSVLKAKTAELAAVGNDAIVLYDASGEITTDTAAAVAAAEYKATGSAQQISVKSTAVFDADGSGIIVPVTTISSTLGTLSAGTPATLSFAYTSGTTYSATVVAGGVAFNSGEPRADRLSNIVLTAGTLALGTVAYTGTVSNTKSPTWTINFGGSKSTYITVSSEGVVGNGTNAVKVTGNAVIVNGTAADTDSINITSTTGTVEVTKGAAVLNATAANDLGDGIKVGGLTITENSAAGTTLTYVDATASTATSAAGTNTITATGTGVVNGVTFTDATGTVQQDNKNVTDLTAGSTIGVTTGTVETADLKNKEYVTYNNVTYVSGTSETNGEALKILANGNVDTGTVLIGSDDGMVDSSAKIGSDGGKYKYSYTGTGTADGISVTITTTSASTASTFSDLDKDEAVTVNNITYTALDANTVKVSDGAGTDKYYSVSAGVNVAKFTASGAVAAPTASTGSVNEIDAGDIGLEKYKNGTLYYFTSAGVPFTSKPDAYAVTVQYTNSTSNVTVSSALGAGVEIITSGVKASIKDEVGGNKVTYTIATGQDVTLNSVGSFTVSDEGVVTSVTGTTMSVAAGNITTTASDGKFDITNATTNITFQKGSAISGAAVIVAAGKTITLTEAGNSSTSATDTVITKTSGNITGIDGDATITGVPDNATIETKSAGAVSINGRTWTVAGDDDGVTFTVDDDQNGKVGQIAYLAKDATVSTTDKLTNNTIIFGSGTATTFKDITAKSGATFTSTAGDGAATVTLNAGDSVTIGTNLYTVKASTDGVTIGAGTLTGLTDGDQVIVSNTTTTTNTITYTVNNGVLEAETSTGKTQLWTISDASEAMGVSGIDSSTPAVPTNTQVTNGDAAANMNNALVVGDTTPVTVTSASSTIYLTKDGKSTLTEDKAAVKLTTSDDGVITYDTLTEKAQTVTVQNDTTAKDNWVINTKGGKDDITYNATTDASISSGNAADDIEIGASAKGDLLINSGEGKDNVTINANSTSDATISAGAGNDTIRANGKGDYVINLDSGDNKVLRNGSTAGDATIIGGSGKDTIQARGMDDVVTGGDGADTFNLTATSMTIGDYTYGADVIQAVTTSGGVTVAPGYFGGDGIVTVSAGTTTIKADVSKGTGTGDFYAVSLVDGDGKNKQNVAWAKEGGSNIDITTYDQAVTLIGDADGKNALYAGTKADTIYSYADNDSVYGGEGKDVINLASGAEGRVVGIATNSSKDAVSGFRTGFSDSDSIYMIDGDVSGVKTTLESVSGGTGKFTFKDGAASLTMDSVGVNTVTGAAEILVNGFKLAALATGATAKVDDANYADIYMGDQSAVDFSAVDGDLFVDLSNDLAGSSAGAKYVGVNAVTGGTGNSTLMGTGSADYIVATGGKTSLFGGAGSDTLVGNSNSADVFFFGDGTGRNTITNFTTQGNENADTLQVYSNITGAKLNGSNVEISTADGSKAILTSQNANSKINVASTGFTGVAKVGSASSANNFTYDNDVTYYGGGNKSDKIAFASGYTDNAEIWMNGIQGKSYASIDVVDGTNTSGSLIVAGDSASQSIIGGKGDTSLWGGAGSATDTLRSSSGSKTMFWWGAGDGNDVVVSASADDSVNLYNVKLSDIDSANSSITNSGVVLALNDGSKLTMQTNRGMTFSIEGQSWTADQSSKEWKQNS